ELEAKKLRPLYWLFGSERMKSRELMKRIEKVVLEGATKSVFNFEKFEGGENSLETILDAAQGFSMMGGTKLIVVTDADELKNLDRWADAVKEFENLEPPFNSVCIFISKSWDGRRKWAKLLQDKIAVIPCEEVSELDREPWIDYLAKRRSLTLTVAE